MPQMVNEGIRVEPADVCLLCGARGNTLYAALRDRLFGAPGVWNTKRCTACGLLWLDPRPIAADIGLLYTSYYTHGTVAAKLAATRSVLKNAVLASAFGYQELNDGAASTMLGAILRLVPPIRDRVGMSIDYLGASNRGRLLDVGCGSGLFLGRMQQLGWSVAGIEPDPAAARTAQEQLGAPVAVGDLTTVDPGEGAFDVVTMNHVIEHALDPVELLRLCRRTLKPGGRVVITTPNSGSLGHSSSGVFWMPLDPPRHIIVFSVPTLSTCVRRADLEIETVRTSARTAAATWTTSRQIAQTGRGDVNIDTSLRFHPWSLVFQAREEVACAMGAQVGEELLMVARRPPE